MTTVSRKGPIIDPGLCRCCGSTKKCRLLNVEYEWFGKKEMYTDMFVDAFGLLLSNLEGECTERCICATCVTRLRDASAFRAQVLHWEQRLLQAKLAPDEGEVTEIKQEKETEAELKEEECAPALAAHAACDDRDADADCSSDVGNDAGSLVDDLDQPPIKTELPLKPKKVKKLKKVGKKEKESKLKRKAKKERQERVAKREMMQAMQEMEQRLEEIQSYEPPPKQRTRIRDGDDKGYHNVLVLVENSFVCPFDSSFSDYYCVYCRHTFADPEKLRSHTSTHDPSSFKDITLNKKLIQIDITKIQCRLCPEPITDLDYLKNHLVNIHGKQIYPIQNEFLKFRLTNHNLTCIECGNVFTFFHALKKHMAEHFGTCICDICGAHYFEERMLLIHQKTHQKKDEEIFPCSECGKNFKSKHSRYIHETKTHRKEPVYQCPKCDQVFFSYSLRYRHLLDTHGEQRTYQCSNCDRSYDSRKSLREHNRRFHLKVFKHQCDLCDKRFYIPSRLKEHLATHTGERNFRCDYCGKSYPRLRGLKVHLQSHASEKKFRCVLCNASFTQNVNLKNHVKRQHQSLDLDGVYHHE